MLWSKICFYGSLFSLSNFQWSLLHLSLLERRGKGKAEEGTQTPPRSFPPSVSMRPVSMPHFCRWDIIIWWGGETKGEPSGTSGGKGEEECFVQRWFWMGFEWRRGMRRRSVGTHIQWEAYERRGASHQVFAPKEVRNEIGASCSRFNLHSSPSFASSWCVLKE